MSYATLKTLWHATGILCVFFWYYNDDFFLMSINIDDESAVNSIFFLQ